MWGSALNGERFISRRGGGSSFEFWVKFLGQDRLSRANPDAPRPDLYIYITQILKSIPEP